MCGICGIIDFSGKKIEQDLLIKMNNSMTLRGPDSEGMFLEKNIGIAMRRLAILDLKTGDQPLFNEDKSIVAFLNGEIYNFKEIRLDLEKKGHRFYSNSDTEVLVHLYEEYGTTLAESLIGMFSFVIWDRNKCRLLIVRDRIGIKPLFYIHKNNIFAFASSMDALKNIPIFSNNVDIESIILFSTLNYIPTPKTIWKDASKLRPGYSITIENNTIKFNKYWELVPNIDSGKDKKYYFEKSRELFYNSIELHSRSDVPVGTFLSGGIDSSAVTGLFAKESQQPVSTFTTDFIGKERNEGHLSKQIAAHFKTSHHFYTLSPELAIKELKELIPLLDEPLGDSAIIPSYFLSKRAVENQRKVILCGAGGDEIFGGYTRFYPSRRSFIEGKLEFIPPSYWWNIRNFAPPNLTHIGLITNNKRISYYSSFSGVNLGVLIYLLEDKKQYNCLLDSIDIAASTLAGNINLYGQKYGKMKTDFENYLVDNVLAVTDKTTMATSVEARVPLLDHRLAEFAFSIPENINFGKTIENSKPILRAILGELMPINNTIGVKTGFNGPTSYWMNDEVVLNSFQKEFKIDHELILSIFGKQKINQLFINKKLRTLSSQLLFNLMNINYWLKNK